MRQVLARCLLLALALALTLLAALPAGAAPSQRNPAQAPDTGTIGVQLLEIPVDAANDPRAQTYIVDHLAPGTVIQRKIAVTNTAAATVPISVYPAAASLTDGSFLGADGRTPNDLSTWTSVTPDALEVPTDGKVTATVTIAVPPDAAPGEQYGVVWAEARSPGADAGGVAVINRVGIRLYISVGPGGPPAADFTIDSLSAQRSADGLPMLVARVHNTGGRALDMSGSLQLNAGPSGLNAGPFPAVLGSSLAVGATESVTVALGELPAGPWNAQITLRSGLVERTADATITFPDAGASPAVSTTEPLPGWLYPAIIGLVVLLALAIGLAVLRHRRRRAAENTVLNDARS